MWAVVAIFKTADINFLCRISRQQNIDRKLICVTMSMLSGSMNPNMIIMLCQLLFFNMDATFFVLLLHYLNAAARIMRFFYSAVLFD